MKKCDCSVPASILNDRREETVPRVALEWGSDRTSVVAVSTLAHRFSRPSPTPKGHLFAPSVISFVEPPHIQSARRLDLLNGMPPFGPITSDNKTHVIDPGNPGPFRVCSTTSTFTIQDGLNKGKEREFVVFVPGTQTGTKCQPATVDCPLIIVMHADKTGNEYLTYSELGTHLASHGYVVIVVNRNGTPTVGADASFENAILVGSVVSEINNGLLGLNSILNSQTVLIGHSAGGKAVQFAFKAPAQLGRPLDSIILMGSTAEVSTPSFNGSIGSFLGIHVRTDTDASASGGKPILHQAKQTTFLVYENAGVNPGDSSSFGFEKHLLYVGEGSELTHYFQAKLFLRAYICAFLNGYVRKFSAYKMFFKTQASIPSVVAESPALTVVHEHEDVVRKIVVGFDEIPKVFSVHVTDVVSGKAFDVDSTTLNSVSVLKFHLSRSSPAPSQLAITLPAAVNSAGFKYLVVSICQLYVVGLDVRPAIDVAFTVRSGADGSGQKGTISLKSLGRSLAYPTFIKSGNTDLTHSGLEEFVLPLSSYSSMSVDVSNITGIGFEFQSNPIGTEADLMIGIIKLLK